MNIIVAGVMGRYPYGGVAWCSLMYLLGLRALGHRVWYLEDMAECNLDPIQNALVTDPRYALEFIHDCLEPYGLSDRWCYVNYLGTDYYGHSRDAWRRVCAGTDLFLNLSGGCWIWRDEYARIPHTAFIDSDPAFTQLEIVRRGQERVEFFAGYDHLFTFGRNIGTPACPIPTAPLMWQPTWQPVFIGEWAPVPEEPRPCFTTVMTWRPGSFVAIGGYKDGEFQKIARLPSLTPVPLEIAATVPSDFDLAGYLGAHGWRWRDAFAVTRTPWLYRDYLRSSRGEFSVAKSTYVESNSGWFSDRTECYLASGRPAVVQDTGFGAHLPVGQGLFAYRTAEEAAAAIATIEADYARHARAARDLALAHFSADRVLPPLLEKATTRPESRRRAG